MNDIELIKKYKKKTNIIVGVSVAMLIILPSIIMFATWSKVTIGVIVAIGILTTIILALNFLKTTAEIDLILKNELDPMKYYAVVHGTNANSKYMLEDIQVAYFLGDYASAIGMINERMAKTKVQGVINEYKLFLSYCYFETGQYDKLLPLIKALRDYATSFKKDCFHKKFYFSLADYFENFINRDYEKCEEIDKIISSENEKFISQSFRMRTTYYKALALYYVGKKNEAKPLFEECVIGCPKFNYSLLSKKYLNLMAEGKDNEYTETTPVINQYVPIQAAKKHPKITFMQRVALCIGGMLLIGAYGLFIDDIDTTVDGYATPLDAICEYSDAEEILTELSVYKSVSLYVYDIGYDCIGVAAVENNEGKYIHNIENVYEIDQWVAFDEYGFVLANIDKEIYYDITDDKVDIAKSNNYSEFKYNDKIYYIYITSIEDNNAWVYSAW